LVVLHATFIAHEPEPVAIVHELEIILPIGVTHADPFHVGVVCAQTSTGTLTDGEGVPPFEQRMLNVVGAVRLLDTSVPLVLLVPVHAPLAVQSVAPVLVHVSVVGES
jgi:hypothetical protein